MEIFKKIRLVSFCFFLISAACAQQKEILKVEQNRLIDIPFSEYVIGEPSLAINPKNDQHLLIGAMMWSTKDINELSCITAVSFDGGKNWKWHHFPDRNSADPWVLLNSEGEAVFSLLKGTNLWTYFSGDGGVSWINPVDHGSGHDHETMVAHEGGVDQPTTIYLLSEQGKRNNEEQYRSTMYFSRSSDGGKTFPYKTNLIYNNLGRNTMTPVVLSDGSVILSYLEFNYPTSEKNHNRLARSHSWTVRSTDLGENFSEPRFITDLASGFPVLEVDKSTKSKDRLYWVTNAESGTQILSFYSTDKGEKWSVPVVVSSSPFSKVIPNVKINNNGIVGISWIEKNEDKSCQNLMFSYSKDGGVTFSIPEKVSDQESCADPSKNGNALRGGWASGGHYTGMTSNSKGDFVLVWADARKGRYQLYMTEIKIKD